MILVLFSALVLGSLTISMHFISEKLIKNKDISRFLVGITPITLVLVGLPFKIVGELKFFAWTMTLLSMSLTIYFILFHIKKKIALRVKILPVLYFLISVPLFFYDSFVNSTVGYVDSESSYSWIENFLNGSPYSYQPGYAIYAGFLVNLVSFKYDLNILGSVLGLFFFIHATFLMNNFKKNMGYVFGIFLLTPIFLEVSKTLIGVTANSMSLYLVICAIVGLTKFLESNETNRLVYLTPLLGSSIIAPLVGYYLIIITFMIFIISLLVKFFDKTRIFLCLVTSLLSMGIYGLNAILSEYFFSIRENTGTSLSLSQPSESLLYIQIGINDYSQKVDTISTPTAIDDNLKALVFDLFSIEGKLRVINNAVDLAGYIILFLSLLLFLIALKRQDVTLVLFSLANIIFGVSVMVGMFEISYLKGRSGWYFLISSGMITSYILVNNIKLKMINILQLFTILALLNIMLNPIQHYRYHDEEIYQTMKTILKQDLNKNVIIFSNMPSFTLLTKTSYTLDQLPLDVANGQMRNEEFEEIRLYVLDFNEKLIDPILSRQYHYSSTRKNNILEEIQTNNLKKLEISKQMEKKLIEYGYHLIVDINSYRVYSSIGIDELVKEK